MKVLLLVLTLITMVSLSPASVAAEDANATKGSTDVLVPFPDYLLDRCESIFVAEYIGYELEKPYSDKHRHFKEPFTLSHPPTAEFRPLANLKGPPIFARNPRIRFDFDDGRSEQEDEPRKLKFAESMMPNKGSKWIIIIEGAYMRRGQLVTLQGNKGRLSYSRQMLDRVLDALERSEKRIRSGTIAREKLDAMVQHPTPETVHDFYDTQPQPY